MLMRGGLLSEIDRGINVKLEWNGKRINATQKN